MDPAMFRSALSLLKQKLGTHQTGKAATGSAHAADPSKSYVEFIGPPGVGKSTVFKALMESSPDLMPLSVLKHRLNLPPRLLGQEFDEQYQLLAAHKLETVSKSDLLPTDKLWALGYFNRIIEDDKLPLLHNQVHCVVADEGLFHNFKSSVEHLLTTTVVPAAFLAGRLIINCHATPERIARQIQQRHSETGHLVPQHKNKTFGQLLTDQEEALRHCRKYADFLAEHGLPVLHVNTESAALENTPKIHEFIQTARHHGMEHAPLPPSGAAAPTAS